MAQHHFAGNRSDPQSDDHVSPKTCPGCASSSIVSTTKNPNADSYYRCLNCGDVWNPERRSAHSGRRWNR